MQERSSRNGSCCKPHISSFLKAKLAPMTTVENLVDESDFSVCDRGKVRDIYFQFEKKLKTNNFGASNRVSSHSVICK